MTSPAPKPSVTNDWLDASTIPDGPDNTHQAAGFAARMKVPFNWFDWAWWLQGKWQKYLRDLLPYGQVSVGESLIDSLANSLLPRLKFPLPVYTTSPYTDILAALLLDSLGLGWTVYAHNPDDLGFGFVLAHNCYFDAADSKWHRRAGGKHSSFFRVGFDATLKLYRRESGSASPWTDTYDAAGWETRITDLSTTAAHFVGTMDVPDLVVATLSVLTNVVGVLTTLSDVAVGRDLSTVRDAAIGRDATVTGDLNANYIESATGIRGLANVRGASLQADNALVVGTDATIGGDADVTGAISAGSGLGYPRLVFMLSGFTGSGPTALGGVSALAAPAGGYYLSGKAGTIRNIYAYALADDGSGYVTIPSAHTLRFTVKIGAHDSGGAITSSSTAFTIDIAASTFANLVDGLNQAIAYASSKIIYVEASTIGGTITACTPMLVIEVQE